MRAAGASEVIEEKDLTGTVLAERIAALLRDPAQLRSMATLARELARPDAARTIVDRAFELTRAVKGC